MQHSLRLAGALIVASFLAACSGGGTPALPNAPQAPGNTTTSAGTSPLDFSAYDAAGNPVSGTHVMAARGSSLASALQRFAHRSGGSGSSSNLIYGGGPVQTKPVIYIDFWGFTSDPSGEAPYLTNFLKGVGGTSWLNTVTQYYQTLGGTTTYISNYSSELAGVWYDNSSVPSRPSSSQVAAEAAKAAAHFGNYSVNALYFVALPTGHDPSGFKTRWCAYHSATSTSGGTIAFVNFPYQTDAGASCGENSVNSGSAGLLDGVSIVGGHELAEAQTDPQPSTGWVDSTGSEIGDKCAWQGLADITLSTGTFAVQPLWSNASSSCVLSYP